MASVFSQSGDRRMPFRKVLRFGTSLQFIPTKLLDRFEKQGGLDRMRLEARLAIRPPRLAIVSISYSSYSSSLRVLFFFLVTFNNCFSQLI
uniref:Uncharacterized protein n=1 Tax=Nelumbo nucifera TaxID=4432 RepID=A0A822ZV40_NELNU|nr:TPA_asm: hypothetical protein HUJ06_018684 [Nelumbo nucifera]